MSDRWPRAAPRRFKLTRGDASLFTADDLRALSNEELRALIKRCYAVLDRRGPDLYRVFQIKADDVDSLIGADRRTYGSRKIYASRLKKLSEVISMVLAHE